MSEMRKMTPVQVPEGVRDAAGKWVALKGGRVVAVDETPDRLYMYLHQKQISNATIFRVPSEGEPELVGLG